MKRLLLSATLLFAVILSSAQHVPKGLNVNDKAPGFTARNQDGIVVRLDEQLKKGPVVLVFYRGYWCPYCNKQLKKLEDSLSLITAKGASLITITGEKPESISKTVEATKLSYPVLFDEGLTIMKNYDVAFGVDENTIKTYKGYGIDFIEINGAANGTNLPVPAMYVINREGKIVFRHFDPDYTKRASVAEILPFL